MGIQANAPWALLLLIPWAIYLWWMLRMTIRLQGARKIAAITMRAFIVLLLICVAADVQPYTLQKQRNVVFIADRSASMHADDKLGEWMASVWSEREEEDRSGIVSVGRNAAVERMLSAEPFFSESSYTFRANVNDRYTDLAGAMQLAGALLTKDGGGRIVLLSDGSENIGDARRLARLLKDAGVAVDVLHMESTLTTDAAIQELKVPSLLRQGETFTFELTIMSTVQGAAQLRLYGNQNELITTNVQLERGENHFLLQNIAVQSGFQSFRAELFMEGDEQEANNAAHAFSRVSGAPAVLIVEGKQSSSANIEAALAASFIRYDTIIPEQLSVELANYAAYDSIILNNVPATRIAEKPMQWIAKAVSDYGIGLVMLGGDDSYGLGGYFKTPVERALPVYMDLQGKKQIPSLGLMLVIDRSGSMSDGKLELAKEAAMRTVELLREEDTVGVIAFDTEPWLVLEPTKLSDRDSVLADIQGIQVGGGTDIYPAVSEGYEHLLAMDAQRKHMILLTDGQSANNNNYSTITSGMVDNHITMSTVAVGDGSDQQLLKRLADEAKGRYYFTNDQSTLPAIFSRETILMSRTYVVEQTFTPSVGQGGDWSSLWQVGIPLINAYVATTPKELAEVALWTPDGDPLLARWTYGSGRTVAWTSDMSGKWAREWVDWSSMPSVLVEWIKWTFPQFESTPYTLSTVTEDGEAKLRVRTGASGSDGGELAVSIQSGDELEANRIKRLMPVGPRDYEVELDVSEPGVYLAQIGQRSEGADGGMIPKGITAGFVIPYSPEYRISNVDGLSLLQSIAAITGGQELSWDKPEQALQFEPIIARQPLEWSRALLLTALLLWLIDIAIRRLSLPWGLWMTKLKSKWLPQRSLSGSLPGPPIQSGSSSAVSRLQKRTSEAGKFYGLSSGAPVDPSTIDTASNNIADAIATKKPQAYANNATFQHAAPNMKGKPNNSAPKDNSKQSDTKLGDRNPVSKENPSPNRNSPSESDGTINRLLAAKNKNKR